MATTNVENNQNQLTIVERIYNRGIDKIEEVFSSDPLLWSPLQQKYIPKRSFMSFLLYRPITGTYISSKDQYKFGY